MMTALLFGLALQARASAIADVSSLAVSPPQLVCQLDMGVLKGEVRRMSWSPDGWYLHVQTNGREVLRDYIAALEDKEVSLAFGEPAWSPVGTRVAVLQKDGRRIYRVMTATVSRPSS